jgi:hypothetical protein
MTCGTIGLIRLASILKTLKDENHFECGPDTVKFVHEMLHVSKLSNKQIIKEVLEIHTVVEAVAVK